MIEVVITIIMNRVRYYYMKLSCILLTRRKSYDNTIPLKHLLQGKIVRMPSKIDTVYINVWCTWIWFLILDSSHTFEAIPWDQDDYSDFVLLNSKVHFLFYCWFDSQKPRISEILMIFFVILLHSDICKSAIFWHYCNYVCIIIFRWTRGIILVKCKVARINEFVRCWATWKYIFYVNPCNCLFRKRIEDWWVCWLYLDLQERWGFCSCAYGWRGNSIKVTVVIYVEIVINNEVRA